MRQQHSCFFAAFFIALFLSFSVVVHSQAPQLGEIERTPSAQHASALLNSSGVVQSVDLLKINTPFAIKVSQAKKVCQCNVESLWFNTLFRPLAELAIHHEYQFNSWYKHQQNLAANILALRSLILAISSSLYADTAIQPNSL